MAVIGLLALVLVGAGAAGALAQAAGARQRAASAADLGALAAMAGPAPDCARARVVVAAHGAVTLGCHEGPDGTVVVRAAVRPAGVAGVLGAAVASARAGRP